MAASLMTMADLFSLTSTQFKSYLKFIQPVLTLIDFAVWVPALGILVLLILISSAILFRQTNTNLRHRATVNKQGSFQEPSAVPVKSRPCRKFQHPKDCEKILACTRYEGALGTNRLTAVVSRALPNERLVHEFCVNNGFTTTDTEHSKAFRRLAYDKINGVQAPQWREIADFAKTLVKLALHKANDDALVGPVVLLDELTQSVTLKISLYVLFGMHPYNQDDDSIQEMATDISERWQSSKGVSFGQGADWNQMRNKLMKIFAYVSHSTENNPYNLILPAYETMWRAVLFGTIELAFKDIESTVASGALKALRRYLADPTRETFEHVEEGIYDSVSVSHVVNEVLRHYPPTQRVYRQFYLTGEAIPETIAADIYACHHDEDFWGEDVQDFKPARWKHISERARSAYMPFGGSRFVCPAKQEFGPRMVGILIAAFATQMSGQEWDLLARDENCSCGNPLALITKDTELNLQRGWYWCIQAERKLWDVSESEWHGAILEAYIERADPAE